MKQARESGVGRLRYGTLEFDFLASSTQSAVAIEPPNAALEAKDLVQNEVDLRQHELEELKFTDPYQYEQLMMENEISAESDAA